MKKYTQKKFFLKQIKTDVWPSPVIEMKVLSSLSTLYSSFTYRNMLLKTCNNTAIGNVYEGYVRSLFTSNSYYPRHL